MTLPSSGELSLSMIQAEYGGYNPIGLNEYYGKSSGLPASGRIAVNDFYGETYAPDSDAVTVDPASNTSTNATRYGYGRNGHTGFIHPESGSSTAGFGSITSYTGLMGGVDLMGIQVCDYADDDGTYAVFDPVSGSIKYTGQGTYKHITITANAASANTMGNWTKVHFAFSTGQIGGWTTLARSDHAFYRNHYDGSNKVFITWRPTNEYGIATPGFAKIYNDIYQRGKYSGTFDVYFD
jgi:hypothetical protein